MKHPNDKQMHDLAMQFVNRDNDADRYGKQRREDAVAQQTQLPLTQVGELKVVYDKITKQQATRRKQ